MKKVLLGALGAGALVAGLTLGALPSPASDHLESPLVMTDGRTDINDLYAFQSLENPDNTVLIMTVNPVAGVMSPTTFDENAIYQFNIDTDGDAKREKWIRFTFDEADPEGGQAVTVSGSAGSASGTTRENFEFGDGQIATGVYDDPFFFDLQAFQDQVKAAGGERTFCDNDPTDFFAGLDVTAIVVEVPTEMITDSDDPTGANGIGIWAETRDDAGRIDRAGRPGIATVLISDGSEDGFNSRLPHDDLNRFGDQVRDTLVALSGLDDSGYTEEEAQAVTEVLLPDILTFDPTSTDGYLNGRGLSDDVIDASLAIITGSMASSESPVLTSDCVDANDVDFLDGFPYLAEPN